MPFPSPIPSHCFDSMFRMGLSEPAHEIMVLITKATREASGEPAHPRSLARAFAVRKNERIEVDKGSDKKSDI